MELTEHIPDRYDTSRVRDKSEMELLSTTLRLLPPQHVLPVFIEKRLLLIVIWITKVLAMSYNSVALCVPWFDGIPENFAYGLSITSASDLERYSQGLRVPK